MPTEDPGSRLVHAVNRYFKRTNWHGRLPSMSYTSLGVALGLTDIQVRKALQDHSESLTKAGFVWSSGWIIPASDTDWMNEV